MRVFSKSCKFWPNRLFFILFQEMRPFLQLFAEKCVNVKFWPTRWFFIVSHEMRQFFMNFFLKFIKTEKQASLVEKLSVLAKPMIFHAFSGNEALFAFFCWKVDRKRQTCQFVRQVASSGQINYFSWLFTKWGTFCKFLLKTWSRRRNMLVCSKNVTFWPNWWFFMVFREMRHFLRLFDEKFIKTQKHASLFEKLQVLTNCMIFRGFSRNEALFQTFCLEVHENNETCQCVWKVASFGQLDDF